MWPSGERFSDLSITEPVTAVHYGNVSPNLGVLTSLFPEPCPPSSHARPRALRSCPCFLSRLFLQPSPSRLGQTPWALGRRPWCCPCLLTGAPHIWSSAEPVGSAFATPAAPWPKPPSSQGPSRGSPLPPVSAPHGGWSEPAGEAPLLCACFPCPFSARARASHLPSEVPFPRPWPLLFLAHTRRVLARAPALVSPAPAAPFPRGLGERPASIGSSLRSPLPEASAALCLSFTPPPDLSHPPSFFFLLSKFSIYHQLNATSSPHRA